MRPTPSPEPVETSTQLMVPRYDVPRDYIHPPPLMDEEPGLDWGRQWAALRRYKWFVLVMGLIGLGGSYAAWKLFPEQYVARGAIWVQDDGGPEEMSRGPISAGGLLNSAGWVQLLRSYTVMDSVVLGRRLHIIPEEGADTTLLASLDLAPQYIPGSYTLRVNNAGTQVSLETEALGVISTAAPGDSLGVNLGFAWTPDPAELTPGRTSEFQVLTSRDAADRLNNQLETSNNQQASFIEIALRGKDPHGQAATLNALMDRFVSVATDLKNAELNERVRVLSEQLATTGQELDRYEGELESFRVRTIRLPSEGGAAATPGIQATRDPAFTYYFSLKERENAVRYDRERLEQVIADASGAAVSIEAFEAIDAVSRSSQLTAALAELATKRNEIRTLLVRYTSQHPPVAQLQRDIDRLELSTIPAMAALLVNELRREEENLASQIERAGSDLAQIPPRSIEESRRERAVSIAGNLYTELRARFEEASLAAASSMPDVQVLDRSVPPELPEQDERLILAGLLFLGCLGLGVIGALVMDRIDPRLRDAGAVTGDLGLSVLGAVPRISPNGKDIDLVREAFRGLRLNVSYAYGSGPVIFAITSPAAGEGKTTVSVNLGVAYAELGKRTLLIDADTRRGNLQEAFELARTPGLTDLINDEASLSAVVHNIRENLDVIPSGSRHSSSPEMLGSKRLMALMGDFKTRYDIIILDAPPMGAGSDAFILGSMTGNLAVVLRSGETEMDYATAKLEPLHRMPIRVLGAILNDVTPDFGYGSSRHYTDYLPGYAAGDEVPELTHSR